MLPRTRIQSWCLLTLPAILQTQNTAQAHDEAERHFCAIFNTRRERAEHVLVIANAVEPHETARALRLARSSMRKSHLEEIKAEERSFLRHTFKEGVARGVACAAGGAAASYALLKVVLLVIPLVPSPYVTRAAMSAVSFGAAVVELATVPDLTTIELLLMQNSHLGMSGRSTIERYNPHLMLLRTLDRHMLQTEKKQRASSVPDVDLQHAEIVDYDETPL